MAHHYEKPCEGCGKLFRRNRSRKRHILGHEYTCAVNVKELNEQGKMRVIGRELKKVVIPPCPMLGDNYRHEVAEVYRLVRVEHDEIAGIEFTNGVR